MIRYLSRGAVFTRDDSLLTCYLGIYMQRVDMASGELGPIHWDSHGFAGALQQSERRQVTELLEAERKALLVDSPRST